jgi:hypothetical protein
MNRCQLYVSAQAKGASYAEFQQGPKRIEANNKHQASVHRLVCTFLNEANFAVPAFLGYAVRPLAKDRHVDDITHQECQGE